MTNATPCKYILQAFSTKDDYFWVAGERFSANDPAGNGLTVVEHLLTLLYDAADFHSDPDIGPFLGDTLRYHHTLATAVFYQSGLPDLIRAKKHTDDALAALNFIVEQSRTREGLFGEAHINVADAAFKAAVAPLRGIEESAKKLALQLKEKAAQAT